ncbi:MAG TPA: hypothetical protein VH601_15810 [Bryobacteraceae bacterium]|jgi:hypothetical protein
MANIASVWGKRVAPNFGNGNGLTLTGLTSPFATQKFPEKFVDWNPLGAGKQTARSTRGAPQGGGSGNTETSLGDFVGRLQVFLNDMKPGETKTVTFVYMLI